MALHSLYCADVPLRNFSLTQFILNPHLTPSNFETAPHTVAVCRYLIVSLKLLTVYAASSDEARFEEGVTAAAEDLMHQQNRGSDEDETSDVTVTSDDGKRRNKTWRRPAASDSDDRKQTAASAQPNTDGV